MWLNQIRLHPASLMDDDATKGYHTFTPHHTHILTHHTQNDTHTHTNAPYTVTV